MGIQGLLPQLRSISARAHVSKYRGKRAAVDAYVLLHRGAYTCAREIVEGEPTKRCTEYCMGRVQMLLAAGVVPVVVFDGGRLPNKAEEEKNRARSRAENKAKARALWQQGNKAAAFECYQRAVDIEPRVAKGFVDALKRQGVEFIVAPYEADAQMAYLALNGMVDVVITEDSDLLTYGCPRVFFKMSREGEGEEIELHNLVHVRELSFIGFTHDMFKEMCVLAGCDFVKALPGIGIKKAHQQIRQRRSFVKVIKSLRFSSTAVPPDYEKRVQRALWVFQHQRVYCPQRRSVVHLHEVKSGNLAHGALVPAAAELLDGEEDFLGPPLPDDVAQAIAAGDLDPITKQPFGSAPATEGEPCTAPLEEDETAPSSHGSGKNSANVQDSLRQIMEGRDGGAVRQRQQQQVRHHRSKGSKPLAAGASNSLAKYGFLRSSGPAMKEFKRPRMASQEPVGQEQQAQQQQEKEEGQREEQQEGTSPAGGSGELGRRAGRQAVVHSLQPADSLPGVQFGGGRGWAGSQTGRQAVLQVAAASSKPGAVLSLLAKLRADLQEPQLDELLLNSRQKAGAPEEGALAGRKAEACPQQLQALAAFGAPSPTLEDLAEGQQQLEPPGQGLSGELVLLLEEPPARVHMDIGATGPSPMQQITPGFYGSPLEGGEPGSTPPGCLPDSLGLAELEDGAAGEAGNAAIADLGHVQAFAEEARHAIDRVTVKAVQDAGLDTGHLRMLAPPAHLHRRMQQQQQQASTAALKRPFQVPRKTGVADKENNAAGMSKRPKADESTSNMFSHFVCK